MPQSVFVKVVGFTDVERHALNTLFRLSEQRPICYRLWSPDAPEGPKLALLDGESYEARLEAESPQNRQLMLVWVGDPGAAPAEIWRSFARPLAWRGMVQAMDGLFMPSATLDLDLALDSGPDTVPPGEAVPDPAPLERHALVASTSLAQRLYLRARLALNQMTLVDEAESAAEVLDLARARRYVLALVDHGLPGCAGWECVRRLHEMKPRVRHVIALKPRLSWAERLTARLAGAEAALSQPLDPYRLQRELTRLCEPVPRARAGPPGGA